MLVHGVVIHDQMYCEPGRNWSVDLSQKAPVLWVAMTALARREPRAGGQVQRGEQRGGARANLMMGHAFDIAPAHRQQGLGADNQQIFCVFQLLK